MRCAVYYRVSRKDTERGISIDVQRDACEPYIQSQGWTIAESYTDDGRSAFTDNLAKRPAFQRLLSDAKARRFDVVVVYLYDRFARKMRLMLQCIEDLERYNIRVVSISQPGDWLSVGMNALIAEQYSRMLSKRMKDVRRWEAQQGRHVGPVPVGYERRQGILYPSAHADAIRYAGERYATGLYSVQTITQMLNAHGYTMPDGASFVATAVEELLFNPVYAGFVVCDDLVVPGKHEPLWSATLWQRIQEVQQQRSRRRTRPVVVRNPLLAGMAVCAGCGAPMWYNSSSASQGRSYYRCSTVTGRPSPYAADVVCDHSTARALDVEDATLAWIASLALTPAIRSQIERAARAFVQPVVVDQSAIETKLKRLARAYADGAYSDSEYHHKRSQLLALLEVAPPATRIDVAMILALLDDLPTAIHEATTDERRAVLGELVSEVYLKRSEVIALRPTEIAEPLFVAAFAHQREWLKSVREWAGWAPGTNSHTIVVRPLTPMYAQRAA